MVLKRFPRPWLPASRRAHRSTGAALALLFQLASSVGGLHAQSEETASVGTLRGLTFAALGDAGEPGPILDMVAQSVVRRSRAEGGTPIQLLFFLGDNFYPTGLNVPEDDVVSTINACLEPFSPAFERLGPENVHAVPGNHDYYCGMLGPIPYGRCIQGNIRENAITSWTFHMIMPSSIRRPTHPASTDSVEFVFFDSALLLATERSMWSTCLDSLERLLRRSSSSRGIRWRIVVAHHSPFSVGEHGGWRHWSDREKRVQYLGNCWSDGMDPKKYVEQTISSQDNCAGDYRAYVDSLEARIGRSRALVQLMLTGHDHSLQLLANVRTGSGTATRTYIVSGAGSKTATVRSSFPPHVWTHPVIANNGESAPGYVVGSFVDDHLDLRFIDPRTDQTLDMGGRTEFRVAVTGRLE